MTELNDNHKRRLVVTFEHIDKLLNEAYHHLNASETPSPFQRYVADALPVQRRVIAAYMKRVSRVMENALKREGVPLPAPSVSALWAYRTALMYAKIAVEELSPKYMRGYGALTPEAVRELDTLTAELGTVLDQMNDYLATGAGKDLQQRLRVHQQTVREAQWLAVLDEVATAHGLVELRPMLNTLVERLESNTLEIAVFGRVSSGKSSMLNHILKIDALPVGVTPVTAVPTRIAYGPQAHIRVAFAQGTPETVDLAQLAVFASEQSNPANARHVTRLDVTLPISWLQGIVLVDTPGLGSVSRNGELESLAYLPRCDIGILLVDATSTLTPEDTAVVHALHQTGADAMVLLNKADLLSEGERLMALDHVKKHLHSDLEEDVAVYLASAKGDGGRLCDDWIDAGLLPRLAKHRELAQLSLRRKVGLLRDTAVLVLESRMARARERDGGRSRASERAKVMREALASLEAASRAWLEIKTDVLVNDILDAATEELLARRRGNDPGAASPDSTVVSLAQERADKAARDTAETVEGIRNLLSDALVQGRSEAGPGPSGTVDLPASVMLPAPHFVLPSRIAKTRLSLFATHFGFGGRGVRRRLNDRYREWLMDSIERYIAELRRWRSEALAALRDAYLAEMDVQLALLDSAGVDADIPAIQQDVQRLRHLSDDLMERGTRHEDTETGA